MSDTEQSVVSPGTIIRFGAFSLLPFERVLLEHEAPVRLGSRALDILILLVEKAGQFVANGEIFQRVWPRTIVVQGNLRVHVAGLRKALGDGREGQRFIVNVPNRGYSFIEPVRTEGHAQPPSPPPRAAASVTTRLPAPLNRVIGQAHALETLADQIRQRRLVTLVGAGGIGKTTVALTVASASLRHEAHAAWSSVHFVDLAPLASPDLVPSALAAALGLAASVDDSTQNLLAFLHDKALLIVFDNCEHLIEAVASLAEDILRGSQGIHILATSREPLRAEGEWVQRLQPLDLPPRSTALTAQQAMAFPAVELFVERASATLDTFVLLDTDAAAAVDICRRLDGIPLAIELAAARIDPFGVKGIAAALDDCFALLSKGRRTALARHQTLRATMEWSFGLLSPRDRSIMLRLSAFAGVFPVEAASAVAGWGELDASDVLDGLSDLVAKSLVTADVGGDEVLFRLLDTTRSYAAAELASTPDAGLVRRRHAEHCLKLLVRAAEAWKDTPATAWLQTYAARLDDVRAALRWAFSPDGDLALGIALAAKCAPLLFQLSFAEEHRQHAARALQAIAAVESLDPQLEFELRIVYGHVLFHTRGLHPDSGQAFATALAIAREANDREMLALAYSSNWMGAYNSGDPSKMLLFARKFEELTAQDDDPSLTSMYDRMKAPALHFFGDQYEARVSAERGLGVGSVVRPPFLSGSQIDRRVSLGVIHARILWVQGLPESANASFEIASDIARCEGESVALAFAMGFCGCAMAISTGDLALARTRTNALLRHAREHSLVAWLHFGLAYEAFVNWSEQGSAGQPPPLPSQHAQHAPHLIDLMVPLHPAYVSPQAIARAEAGLSGWCAAEVLRVRGDRLRASDPQAAEALLVSALELARSGGALAWEIRAATTLGGHWLQQGRADQASRLLGTTLARVREGLGTPDVVAALAVRQAAGQQARRVVP
ncbi:MAG TPA: winged helix-turn-helix domain-containing protein [Ideonella sp.]|nr:winged helix-turn-helix domain-containing protein [Ideonella sp.]